MNALLLVVLFVLATIPRTGSPARARLGAAGSGSRVAQRSRSDADGGGALDVGPVVPSPASRRGASPQADDVTRPVLRVLSSPPRELGPADFPPEPVMYVASSLEPFGPGERFIIDVEDPRIWLRPDLSPREARRAWGEAFAEYLARRERAHVVVPDGAA